VLWRRKEGEAQEESAVVNCSCRCCPVGHRGASVGSGPGDGHAAALESQGSARPWVASLASERIFCTLCPTQQCWRCGSSCPRSPSVSRLFNDPSLYHDSAGYTLGRSTGTATWGIPRGYCFAEARRTPSFAAPPRPTAIIRGCHAIVALQWAVVVPSRCGGLSAGWRHFGVGLGGTRCSSWVLLVFVNCCNQIGIHPHQGLSLFTSSYVKHVRRCMVSNFIFHCAVGLAVAAPQVLFGRNKRAETCGAATHAMVS